MKGTTGNKVGRFVKIRAELVEAELPVWRELIVDGDVTLRELHSVLQICFDWDNAHLFTFNVGKKVYAAAPERGEVDCSAVEIGEIAQTAKKMTYRYDFGDDWEVLLTLQRTDEGEGRLFQLLGGEGAGPLEDCGGIFRHNEIVEALRSLKKMDPELREWIPEDYEPTRFKVDSVRKALARLEVAIDSDDDLRDSFDEEDDEDAYGSPLDPDIDSLGAFPMDEHGEPVLYDPNDRRGPDPERWNALSEGDKLRSVFAYHEGDPMMENVEAFSLHCSLHAAVEQQAVENNPRQVAQTLARLTAGGRGRRHSAVHLVSVGFLELIRRQGEGDERALEAYVRWLEQLPSDAVERRSDGEDLPELPDLGNPNGSHLRSIAGGKGKQKKKRKR